MPKLRTTFDRLNPRQVHGISAALLPYDDAGKIDWTAFATHVARTHAAGLGIAVNMDTGFGDLLTAAERSQVLDVTRAALGAHAPLYAGCFADPLSADPVSSYLAAIETIAEQDAIPVVVQCAAMRGLDAAAKANLYRRIVAKVPRAIAFELSPVFAPHGEIWDDETFARILEMPQIVGAKHSSLERSLELRRLEARDRLRPEFRLYTGNDLAIDMVLYGSDYLLGLSTFAAEKFAARDRALAGDDLEFLSLNDALQHLGNVGFRAPVPAYKHSAAMFLHIVGVLDHDHIHPRAARRPQSDRIMLYDCARRLDLLADPERAWGERVAPFI